MAGDKPADDCAYRRKDHGQAEHDVDAALPEKDPIAAAAQRNERPETERGKSEPDDDAQDSAASSPHRSTLQPPPS